MHIMLISIKHRRLLFKQRELLISNTLRIRRANQLLQPKALEVRGEILREVRPLRVIARQQNRLTAKHIGIELHIGVHLSFDITVLRIELIVLRTLRSA